MAHDIRDYLEIRTAHPMGFSPDGSKLLVGSNLPGTMQLYRMPSAGGLLTQVTSFDEPVTGRYLRTADRIVFGIDEGGNERTQIHLIDDDGSNHVDLTKDPEHIHRPGGTSRDGRLLVHACNRRNGTDFDVFVRDLASGQERCVFDRGGLNWAAGFSPDGRWVGVIAYTQRPMDAELYLASVDGDEVVHCTPHGDEAMYGMPAWLPDSSGFYFPSDEDREFASIARYDMASRSWTWALETSWDSSCDVDDVGRNLLVETNEEGYSVLRLYDPATLALRTEIELPFRGTVPAAQFSRDGSKLAYSIVGAKIPGDTWVYDVDAQTSRRVTNSPNTVEEFVEPALHRFASFDDESVPVFVYGSADGPRPAVVWVHGGPESQERPIFNPIVQYLVSRGYVVLAPNVRGSTGYGKRYHHLDDKRKRLDSVADLASLHAWASAEKIVDPSRVAVMGGSYGGFMTLAALAFQPTLWAAGVDVVGIANWVTFLENQPPWRRRFREREYGSLDDDREFLVSVSPLTHADEIRAPLFVIHGRNDPRVPLVEAEQIHAAVSSKGLASGFLVYDDEGHGLAKLKNRLDAYPKAVDFLDGVLRS